MGDIRQSGRIPLLVGGTMLYFKALRDGLAPMPEADPGVRATISAMAQAQGWSAVHARLAEVDPAAAQRIHPNDPQRLQRALEVFMVSGRSVSDLQARNQAANNLSEKLLFVSIQPTERSVLHARIAQRFRQMLDEGLVEEVRQLHQRGDLHTGLPSIRMMRLSPSRTSGTYFCTITGSRYICVNISSNALRFSSPGDRWKTPAPPLP